MNNLNIHLKIRNPKKQAIDVKLESRACYLMNRRIDEKRNESGNHRIGNCRLGLQQCGVDQWLWFWQGSSGARARARVLQWGVQRLAGMGMQHCYGGHDDTRCGGVTMARQCRSGGVGAAVLWRRQRRRGRWCGRRLLWNGGFAVARLV